MMRTPIGTVGYLNAVPLTSRIDRERVEILRDHPSTVARRLEAGEVKAGLVPVAALFADGIDHRIVPGVCIGAEGPVDSVLLVGRQHPSTWRRVLLDGVSRTSVALSRVLLSGPLGARLRGIEVLDVPAGQALALAGPEDGALVIGDAARCIGPELVHRIDLAAAWTEWTGLPFVFAVWAGPPDLDPGLIRHLKEAGLSGVASIDADFAGADHTYLRHRIRYPLDDRALMGLRRFAALGHGLGLFTHADVCLFGPPVTAPRRCEHADRALGGARVPLDRSAIADAMRAPPTQLSVAAHLCRTARRPPGVRVRWLVDDAADLFGLERRVRSPQASAEAPLPGLQAAVPVTDDVSALAAARDEGCVVVRPVGASQAQDEALVSSGIGVYAEVDPDEDVATQIQRLQALEQSGLSVHAVEIGTGSDAVAEVRAAAVARLALPDTAVFVTWCDSGARAQMALFAGADGLLVASSEGGRDRMGAVARVLRDVGTPDEQVRGQTTTLGRRRVSS